MCRYVEVFPACVALTWMSINVSICGSISCMCGNYLDVNKCVDMWKYFLHVWHLLGCQ